VVIWGAGGMGKTIIARSIYQQIIEKVDIAIVLILAEQEKGRTSTLRDQLISEFSITSLTDEGFQRLQGRIEKTSDPEIRFRMILNFLNNELEDKRKLIVIDNIMAVGKGAQLDLNNLKELLALLKTKFLITSREEIEEETLYHLHLKPLEEEKALTLFYSEFQEGAGENSLRVRELSRQKAKIREIVKELNNHPLFISLFGKLLGRKRSLTPEKLLEKIRHFQTASVKIKDQNSRKRIPLQEYYSQLLGIGWKFLGELERTILKKIAILPANYPLRFEKLTEFFSYDEDEIVDEVEDGIIEDLENGGWLKGVDEESWQLHPIVKEYLLYSVGIDFEEIESQILWGLKLLKNTEDPAEVVRLNREGYIPIVEGITQTLLLLFSNGKGEWEGITRPMGVKFGKWYDRVGLIFYNLGNYEKGKEYFQIALKIFQKIGDRSVEIAKTYCDLGLMYHYLRDYTSAENYYKIGLQLQLELKGEINREVADIYHNLGHIYTQKGDYSKGEEFFQKALKIRLQLFGKVHPQIALSYNSLGSLFEAKGDYSKSIEYYQKGLELYFQTVGAEHPNVANIYNNLGLVYRYLGKYDKGEEYYRKSLDIWLNTVGPEHPWVAIGYSNLGYIYQIKKDYSKAEEFYKKGLKIRLKFFGPDHPDTAIGYEDLGILYFFQKDYSKAEEYFQKVLQIRLKFFGTEYPITAVSYNNLGKIYYFQNNYIQSEEYYKKAMEIWIKTIGKEHPNVGKVYNNLGELYLKQKKCQLAQNYFQKALKIAKKKLGETHPDTLKILKNLETIQSIENNCNNPKTD